MKFKLYRKPTLPLTIPNPAMKLADMNTGESITAHVAEGAIVLLRESMTAAEAIAAIGALSELCDGLIFALTEACEEKCFAQEDGQDECECMGCKRPECRGIELPPCLLDEAGFPKGSGFEAFVSDCGIVIKPITVLDEDFVEELPDVLRSFIEENEVDIGALRALVENGDEVVYGG